MPISYSEDRTTATTFKEPIITNTDQSTMTSASAAIVDSVTWPDPRSQCSLAGNYQVPWPLAQRLDGMSFATYGLETCHLTKSDLQSLFVIDRFFVKLFSTEIIEAEKYCQEYFGFALPDVLWAQRVYLNPIRASSVLCLN